MIAALHNEEIKKDSQRILKLEYYSDRYNWEGLGFPVALNMIGKFEKNNSKIVVNVLFNSKNCTTQLADQSLTDRVKIRRTCSLL